VCVSHQLSFIVLVSVTGDKECMKGLYVYRTRECVHACVCEVGMSCGVYERVGSKCETCNFTSFRSASELLNGVCVPAR